MSTTILRRMHIYHLLAGISTILALSSIAPVFFYSPPKTILYTLLVFPTLLLLHHLFVFLAVPSPISDASSQRVNNDHRRQRCALFGPLSEIEKSTLNLLSLALLTVLALASGGAAWLFIALDVVGSTTPTSNTTTDSWSYFNSPSASALSRLASEHDKSPPAAMWILQGGLLLTQAIVLASMFAIAVREAGMAAMASRRGWDYEGADIIGSDVEQPMCVDESRSEVNAFMVSDDEDEEK